MLLAKVIRALCNDPKQYGKNDKNHNNLFN